MCDFSATENRQRMAIFLRPILAKNDLCCGKFLRYPVCGEKSLANGFVALRFASLGKV